ncbi:MAG: hypothetical protein PQJ47_06660 [Sphaerochaetaceae bacterium]|nr:hypothetical protein [Sphaerochaetaceae bacterium]MDC7247159.1 hypothetical protein [Sphaerochaetaceae bacterium]
MNEDAQEFIDNLEKRFGGKVDYRTYSTWFASTEGIIREFGVFIYEINGIFHFEDFERKAALFGIALTSKKKKPEYVKMEGSFERDQIESITQVTKSKATSCAKQSIKASMIPTASTLERIFSPLVTRVALKDGTNYFFELINHKEFLANFKGDH